METYRIGHSQSGKLEKALGLTRKLLRELEQMDGELPKSLRDDFLQSLQELSDFAKNDLFIKTTNSEE